MTSLGQEFKNFNLPVCNKFTPTIHRGQLCYKLDLNKFYDSIDVKSGKENGVTFVLDYNEEQMAQRAKEVNDSRVKVLSKMHSSDKHSSEALIFLDTLGERLI